MNIINNIKLKKKLLISYLIIVIVPIIVITYFLTNKLYYQSFSSTIQNSNASIKQLSDNFLNKLSRYNEIIDSLFGNSILRNYIEHDYDVEYESFSDLENKLIPIFSNLESRNTFIKIYSNNQTIAYSGITNNLLSDLENSNWYDPTIFNSKVNWSKPVKISAIDDKSYIVCYRKSIDFEKKVTNINFAMFIAEDELYSLIKKEKDIGGKIIIFYNEKGDIITTTERESLQKNIKELYNEDGKTINEVGSNKIIKYKGNKYFILKLNVNNENLNINNWNIIYLIPANNMVSNVNDIWLSSLLLGIVCITFSLAIIFWISGNITGRIGKLLKVINNTRDTNFKMTIEISGTDEIGSLEKDFNSMIKEIDTLVNEIYKTSLRMKDVEIYSQKVLVEKKEAELIALQEQINPHYLFNTLEIIRMNLVLKGDGETANIIRAFSEGFRVCIESNEDIYLLRDEMRFVENYFAIQKYRFGSAITFLVDIPENMLDYYIPKLLIQPLVENSICHGITKKQGGGTVKIEVYQVNSTMHIKVSDSGIGIDENELEKVRNIIYNDMSIKDSSKIKMFALKNLHKRLNLMYGSAYGLKISSTMNIGTYVEVNLPVCCSKGKKSNELEG
jgi:Putative regulator of cell autolysis